MTVSTGKGPWYRLWGSTSIDTIGRITAHYKHPNRLLPYWVLGIVHSGERTIQVGADAGRLATGGYFLLPPHIYHEGINEDMHDVTFIHFVMDGAPTEPPGRFNADDLVLPIFGESPVDANVHRSFHYLHEIYQSELAGERFLHVQLEALLYQLSFHMQKRLLMNSRNSRLCDDMLKFILARLAGDLNATAFERQFGLSYRQLNLIFKNQFQTTIKQKTVEMRVDHAFNLLMLGESIANAAEKSGFQDYFYFLKCFKKLKGVTPKELKKSYFR